MKRIRLAILTITFFLLTGCTTNSNSMRRNGPPSMAAPSETKTVTINNINFRVDSTYKFFTWDTLPTDVPVTRQPLKSFTNVDGKTHKYEVIFVKKANLNWYQAAKLAEDAGGYLASITSEQENDFVFSLVNDEKYFWKFPRYDGRSPMNHHEIKIGPFLGGYQPEGSPEPAGNWRWLSGEKWEYENWAKDLGDGVVDKDPRNNSQPNDSGHSGFGQRVMGFGEMNKPVPTWGDYMDDVSTYGRQRTPGRCYAFIIEYPETTE